MFFKIGVFKHFATVKHLCLSLSLIKLKKEEALRQVNIARFLRTAFFIEYLAWLLLSV